MSRPVPSFRPSLVPEDFAYVARLLKTGWLSPGPLAASLERAVAASLLARDAVALDSGSSALFLALKALGVGPGDRVALPSLCCASVLHAVRESGAEPLLLDVDPVTLNPEPDGAKRALRARTRALILTHTSGYPADPRPFLRLGPALIEDCCLAAGALVAGRPVGSFGRAAALSFYATKPASAGKGGALASRSSALTAAARRMTNHDRDRVLGRRYNRLMPDLVAGLALAQWRRLPELLARRRALAERYRREAPGLEEPRVPAGSHPSHHHFLARNVTAHRLSELRRRGVCAERPVFRPLHRYFAASRGAFPGTEEAFSRTASLPLFPAMTSREADRVLAAAREVLRA